MSRFNPRNPRGRQALLASARITRAKQNPNDTYQEPGSKKKNNVCKNTAITPSAKRKRRGSSSTSEGGEESDGDSDEDAEEGQSDDDEPALFAPSCSSKKKHAAGRYDYSQLDDNLSLPGDVEPVTYDDRLEYEDPNLSPEENRKLFEQKIFAETGEDSDAIYQAVDEISDSDEERASQGAHQDLSLFPGIDDDDDPESLLNEIEGMSAYGFGNDSEPDAHHIASSQESDSFLDTERERRVHFATDHGGLMYKMRFSESPVLGRALLPSALPNFADLDDDADDSMSIRQIVLTVS